LSLKGFDACQQQGIGRVVFCTKNKMRSEHPNGIEVGQISPDEPRAMKLPLGDASDHRRLRDLMFFEKTHSFPKLAEPHPKVILAVFQYPWVCLFTYADAVNLAVFLTQKTRE